MLYHGMTPDRLTYNTLILACVKSQKMDAAKQFFEDMKVTSLHLSKFLIFFLSSEKYGGF